MRVPVGEARPFRAIGVTVALLWAACGSQSEVGGSHGGGGAGGTNITLPTQPSSGGGSDAGTGVAPTPDGNCGNRASTMTQSPADLLVVLDRSGSMVNDIASDNPCDPPTAACAQRWATMVTAMANVLTSAPSGIHWGLKLFSTPGVVGAQGGTPEGCAVNPGVEVPVDQGSPASLRAAMTAATPNYNTPTRAAIEAARAYLTSVSDGRAKNILLATDGEPNCAKNGAYATEPDMAATLAAIDATLAAGIKVYVIGVGPSTGNLDEMARRGGTGSFYPALSPGALNQALATVAGIVASCVYDMGAAPPDPDNLGVYLDKTLVPRSATDGWVLSSATAVTFTGPTCDRVKAGRYKDVQVLFGCPGTSSIPAVIP
jgi:hypothetical protein